MTGGPRRAPAGVPVLLLATALLAVALLAGCGGSDGPPERGRWPAATAGPSTVTLTAPQRRVADQIVSVFENGTTEPRYDYVENLGDGRGYTCGKIGFTTSSTEVRDAVEAYVAQQPQSALARHLPRLRELARTGRGDVDGLAGFPEDWADAARDQSFRDVQDALADRLTFDPALALARRLGIRTALGVAILFDTAVQHGMADDPDGTPALVARATGAAGGSPADGVEERRWLTAFLDARAATLRNAHNAESRQVWAESVDRVAALRRLVDAGRHRLVPPLEVEVFGDRHQLR